MTDEVQKIREEVVRMHNLLPVMDGDNISVNYADRICTTLEMYIDSLQEEPVNRTTADVESAMQEVEEKSRVFTEVHKGEDADTILAQMRGEELVSEDLELSLEDIKTIDKLLNQCVDCNNPYQEVLKRFKDYKERKEK